MLEYKIKVQDYNGDFIGEFDRFRNLTFNKRLNNYGECSFDIPADDTKLSSLVALRRFTVWVYRGSSLVWSGEMALRKGKLTDDGDNWVSLYCYDWFEQLVSRYTDSERLFSATDAGEIAWTLIDETQTQSNGDFGITEGTIETTMDRDRSYYNQNIAQAIINLTNVLNGFDFEITNSRVFNVYVLRGTDRSSSIILEYGKTIKNINISEDFVNPVNRAIVLGEADGETTLQRIERNNTTLQGLYKVRESVLSVTDISELETFEEKGDGLIRKQGSVLNEVDFDLVSGGINITQFDCGDAIRLKVQEGVFNIDEDYRIYEWTIKINDDGSEHLSLVLGNFRNL